MGPSAGWVVFEIPFINNGQPKRDQSGRLVGILLECERDKLKKKKRKKLDKKCADSFVCRAAKKTNQKREAAEWDGTRSVMGRGFA